MRADPKQESRTYLVSDACMCRQAVWPPREWRCQLSALLVARRSGMNLRIRIHYFGYLDLGCFVGRRVSRILGEG